MNSYNLLLYRRKCYVVDCILGVYGIQETSKPFRSVGRKDCGRKKEVSFELFFPFLLCHSPFLLFLLLQGKSSLAQIHAPLSTLEDIDKESPSRLMDKIPKNRLFLCLGFIIPIYWNWKLISMLRGPFQGLSKGAWDHFMP